MPDPEQLAILAAGNSIEPDPPGGKDQPATKPNPLVPSGQGLAALPKRTVEKIWAEEYIDFSKLPPAKGKMRALNQGMDGQFIIVQAEDLLQTKKLIPDLSTWLQCYALYVAVHAQKHPDKVVDKMAYLNLIAKASKKYKWPSWIVYDQNFRIEAASSPAQSWAKVDPSIYSQCFLGMAKSPEGWCQRCQCLDHSTDNCPASYLPPRKRQYQATRPPAIDKPVCIKFNRSDGGDCSFGARCRFMHICSKCRGSHPLKLCPSNVSTSNSKDKTSLQQ